MTKKQPTMTNTYHHGSVFFCSGDDRAWPLPLRLDPTCKPLLPLVHVFKWRRIPRNMFSSLESELSFYFNQEYVCSVWKHISPYALFVFPPMDPLVINFSQIGPWSSTPHNSATLTPFEVIPKPTSSYRRALSLGNIFTRWYHSENNHFALARK